MAEEEEGARRGSRGSAGCWGAERGPHACASRPRRPLPTREGRALSADALLSYGVSVAGHIELQPRRAHSGLLKKARQASR